MIQKFVQLGVAALAVALGGSAHAQVTARDAVGAEVRSPTAAEAQALAPVTTAKSRPVGMLSGKTTLRSIKHADGTVEQELDTSTAMYSVARRNPDGSVSMYCVTGAESAEKLAKAKPDARVLAKASKEHQHDVK